MTGYTRENKIEVIRLIRQLKPDIVFTHGSFEQFPDHKVAHNLVMAAIAGACGPWYQEVELAPWAPKAVLGYEVWNPMTQFALAVPITDEMELKIKSLMAHRSQLEDVSYLSAVKGLASYRGGMSFCGEYAEVFETLKLDYRINLQDFFGV